MNHIDAGLALLRDAFFSMEKAFFALHRTTTMTAEHRQQLAELLDEMDTTSAQLRASLLNKTP